MTCVITSKQWLEFIKNVTNSSLSHNAQMALISLITDIGLPNDATRHMNTLLLEIEAKRAKNPDISDPTPTIGDIESSLLCSSESSDVKIICYGNNKFKWVLNTD